MTTHDDWPESEYAARLAEAEIDALRDSEYGATCRRRQLVGTLSDRYVPVAEPEPFDHGPGCDGPFNCTCDR